jgi:hypothetical protein
MHISRNIGNIALTTNAISVNQKNKQTKAASKKPVMRLEAKTISWRFIGWRCDEFSDDRTIRNPGR